MFSKSDKSKWIFFLFVLAGVVFGGFIGNTLGDTPYFSWLNYGSSFGLPQPFVLDLQIITLTFGFTVKFTIAGILGIVLAVLIYRKI
ncbi:MAG: DUF4321 domain-containing protein [Clostridiales bacterium]|jgi:hypothetical protein|nr:DUF4321 domain-containing protein [Clostridiales bacterium]